MSAKLVAYLRVSTRKQGESGLGLEGQQTAIDAYAKQVNGEVIAKYVEIESGKRSDRPDLIRAIAQAKRMKAVLIVAKLDRLARNVAFLSRLLESGVEFVACDNPSANRLTIHILAAVAEAEAKAISDRTKAALASAKVRGKAAADAYSDIAPLIHQLHDEGMTLQAIADKMNAEGQRTPRGAKFAATTVYRIILSHRLRNG